MWLCLISLLFPKAFASPDLSDAIRISKELPVELIDGLGEGEGCFDADSQYTPTSVNCQTWLQWTISRAYAGNNQQQFQRYMDDLRYYEEVSFAHRKHFVDRWVMYDPEPLKQMDTTACRPDQSHEIVLNLSTFRNTVGYTQSLYQEELSGIEKHIVPSLSVQQTTTCLHSLDAGWYVGFFVASPQWIYRWSTIGDLGLVHAMIFEIREGHQGDNQGNNQVDNQGAKRGGNIRVHHASIDAKKVVEEPWTEFHQRLSSVAQGYRIFALTPNWTVDTDMPKRVSECP